MPEKRTEEQKKKHREYQRKWYQENKEKALASIRKWQQNNKERNQEYITKYLRKKYREDPVFREKMKQKWQDWKNNNPEMYKLYREDANRRRQDKKVELKDDFLEES